MEEIIDKILGSPNDMFKSLKKIYNWESSGPARYA